MTSKIRLFCRRPFSSAESTETRPAPVIAQSHIANVRRWLELLNALLHSGAGAGDGGIGFTSVVTPVGLSV